MLVAMRHSNALRYLRRDPSLKGHGGGGSLSLCGSRAALASLLDRCGGAVVLFERCGFPAAWSSTMPLSGIVELSSLSAHSGRIVTRLEVRNGVLVQIWVS